MALNLNNTIREIQITRHNIRRECNFTVCIDEGHGTVVGLWTRLRIERSSILVRFPERESVQTGFEKHTTSCLMDTGIRSGEQSGRDVKLTTSI